MTTKDINTKKGFTIIEVVLVLAIAGLIFLMVFIALPALQRSQRDTQRRDDMARFLSQLNQYQANHSGSAPTSSAEFTSFVTDYLKIDRDKFADPSGADYTISFLACSSASNCTQKSQADDYKSGTIRVYTNARCNGEGPEYIKGNNKVAITYKLEGAGIYCGNI